VISRRQAEQETGRIGGRKKAKTLAYIGERVTGYRGKNEAEVIISPKKTVMQDKKFQKRNIV
jgi:hypothetical protein